MVWTTLARMLAKTKATPGGSEKGSKACATAFGGPGVPPRYDRDGFYGALTRRIQDHRIPATQAELVREMLDWFGQRTGIDAPDESTVRRKITTVWRELGGAG